MRRIGIFWRWSCYWLTGTWALVIIFLYQGWLRLDPWQYVFTPVQLYLGVNWLLLPFFRYRHPGWFIALADDFKSNKTQALENYHRDLAQHATHKKWSVNGTNLNPYEYTSPYTMAYDNSLAWTYSLAKALVVSVFFLVLSPVFYLRGYLKK